MNTRTLLVCRPATANFSELVERATRDASGFVTINARTCLGGLLRQLIVTEPTIVLNANPTEDKMLRAHNSVVRL